jgi:hypothetical protein
MKFVLLTIISVLIISTATFGVLYYKERNKCDLLEIESTLGKNHLKSINVSLKGAFLDSQNYNNVKLTLPISAESKDTILCLFISKYHCIECVNASLEYCVANNNIIPDSNIVVFADFNPNAIKHLKAEYQLRCKIVSVFNVNVVIANNKYPCFFIYNKETSQTEMFLFPLKNEPEMMMKYFENVSSKYFAQIKDNSHDEK